MMVYSKSSRFNLYEAILASVSNDLQIDWLPIKIVNLSTFSPLFDLDDGNFNLALTYILMTTT